MSEAATRLFVSSALGSGAAVSLDPAQAHRLLHVLRLSKGDKVLVFDGSAGEWTAEIVELSRDRAKLAVLSKVREQTALQDLHFIFAPLKQARLDYTVQKAVELGVSAIQPAVTARTVAAKANPVKMRANAAGAAEQCGLLSVPEVRSAVALTALLKKWPPKRKLIFCDENAAPSSPLRQLERLEPGPLAVLAGPEGGFTVDERAVLLAKPFVVPLSLGPRIMRADTAAVAALALVNAVLGDWR